MNDLLVQIIVVAVIANVVLIVGGLAYARLRRGGGPAGESIAFAAAQNGSLTHPTGPSRMTVSSGPSMTDHASPEPSVDAEHGAGEDDAAEPAGPWPQPQDLPASAQTSADMAPEAPEAPAPPDAPEPPVVPEGRTSEPAVPPAVALLDPETGLATALAWAEVYRHEDARLGRYGRPVTIVALELHRLDDLAERFGQDTADRLIPAVATTLRRSARSSDLVARQGRARFMVLMPETDEIRAINFVERVREACDTWLEASAVSVRLVIGWASVGAGGDLDDALRLAVERMQADRAAGQPDPRRRYEGR